MIRSPRRALAWILAPIAALVAIAAGLAAIRLGPPEPPSGTARGPTIAEPRAHLSPWVERHARHVSRAMAGEIPLLFLGDSITRGWFGIDLDGDGPSPADVWRARFSPRRALNFGVDGDHVEHLLWRIRHGELADLQPAVVVLMIGTNNIGLDPPEAIAEGVAAVIDEIHRRSPRTVILLMGLLPRGTILGHGQLASSDLPDLRIAQINRLIAPLGHRRRVAFIDFGDRLLGPDGRINPLLQPDLLHPSAEGYAMWADAIEPTLRLLLGPPGDGGSVAVPVP